MEERLQERRGEEEATNEVQVEGDIFGMSVTVTKDEVRRITTKVRKGDIASTVMVFGNQGGREDGCQDWGCSSMEQTQGHYQGW
jgi:hypothetical protein